MSGDKIPTEKRYCIKCCVNMSAVDEYWLSARCERISACNNEEAIDRFENWHIKHWLGFGGFRFSRGPVLYLNEEVIAVSAMAFLDKSHPVHKELESSRFEFYDFDSGKTIQADQKPKAVLERAHWPW